MTTQVHKRSILQRALRAVFGERKQPRQVTSDVTPSATTHAPRRVRPEVEQDLRELSDRARRKR